MAGYAAGMLALTARRSRAAPASVTIGTATGTAVGVLAYALGPLGFPLRFTGPWPAGLYDAALALGVLLALAGPVAAGLAATRRAGSLPAGFRAGQGAKAGLCTGAAAALVVAVLSTATIALLPYDTGLQHWAASHIGHWTPVVGQWTPIRWPSSGISTTPRSPAPRRHGRQPHAIGGTYRDQLAGRVGGPQSCATAEGVRACVPGPPAGPGMLAAPSAVAAPRPAPGRAPRGPAHPAAGTARATARTIAAVATALMRGLPQRCR
jgi:hypothetical protein